MITEHVTLPNWDDPTAVVAYLGQLDELEELRTYKAEVDKLADIAMNEQCNVNQHHCGCVPVLRAYIAQLKAELSARSENRGSAQ